MGPVSRNSRLLLPLVSISLFVLGSLRGVFIFFATRRGYANEPTAEARPLLSGRGSWRLPLDRSLTSFRATFWAVHGQSEVWRLGLEQRFSRRYYEVVQGCWFIWSVISLFLKSFWVMPTVEGPRHIIAFAPGSLINWPPRARSVSAWHCDSCHRRNNLFLILLLRTGSMLRNFLSR